MFCMAKHDLLPEEKVVPPTSKVGRDDTSPYARPWETRKARATIVPSAAVAAA
jgi:hypothetical protein